MADGGHVQQMGGHAWQEGAYVVGGMHDRGGCMVGGVHDRRSNHCGTHPTGMHSYVILLISLHIRSM